MKKSILFARYLILGLLTGCQEQLPTSLNMIDKISMEIKPLHSFAKPNEAVIKHLMLDVKVNFEDKILEGSVLYNLECSPLVQELVLDTKALNIKQVFLNDSVVSNDFFLGKKDPLLGQALHIPIDSSIKRVKISYTTSPKAEALQWLNVEQTAGEYPFLFTQSQAILCRSWIPIQDAPSIKFTYEAQVKVPTGYMALMSAENPQKTDSSGIYNFKMPHQIPAYLMALAVGHLAFHRYDSITGVYAEPLTLNKAKAELEDTHLMVKAAETLYGPYKWGRFDVLMLPPSFPFGGMENPTLTFATPTILAGDKSLTSLIAHELAHSWSGNLVTNASWEDFWLNEGFTVYFEYRIMEAVYSKDYADMLALTSQRELEAEVAEMIANGKAEDTKLKLDLKGRNPDEGLTAIAYDKGYFLLKRLEEIAGRKRFDQFLTTYFDAHAFQTITTESFILYAQQYLFAKNKLGPPPNLFENWIYGVGLPKDMPVIKSVLFERVDETLVKWLQTKDTSLLSASAWSTHEWLYFIHQLPDTIGSAEMKSLDEKKDFTHSGNAEIKTAWMLLAIQKNYKPIYPELENFLLNTGRRKFLMPLYSALLESQYVNREYITKIYGKARSNYHYVSYSSLDDLLNYRTQN